LTEQGMKEMAEMLRQGAKMLSTNCPECGAPLFQLKTGELFCPREKREVKLLKEGESPEGVKQEASLEKTLQDKLNLLQQRLDNASELSEIRELTETITALLDALARLKSKKP
jgi:UPF0148 protein